jgi:hypothetical protein
VLHGFMSGTQLLAIGLVIAGGLLWMRRSASSPGVPPVGQAAG